MKSNAAQGRLVQSVVDWYPLFQAIITEPEASGVCAVRRFDIGRRFVYRSHRSRSRRLLDHVPRSGDARNLLCLASSCSLAD